MVWSLATSTFKHDSGIIIVKLINLAKDLVYFADYFISQLLCSCITLGPVQQSADLPLSSRVCVPERNDAELGRLELKVTTTHAQRTEELL